MRTQALISNQMLAGMFAVASVCCSTVFAASVNSTVDGGGQRTTSANYTVDASIGTIGGISTAGGSTAKHGYVGQLTEVTGLSVTGLPSQVNEGATSQLSGIATMDDNSITALIDSDIKWSIPSWPLAAISASGVASAAVVYANASATVNGVYLGVSGSGSLLVLDTIPDNYGSYAGDGLPDSWQNQYFGLDNPNAAPNKDVTGTGQNNLFKYVAGLDPTNPASVFLLRVESITNQPSQKNLIFTPRYDGRTYTPMFRTNLLSGSWETLTNTNVTDNSTQRTVTDLEASQPQKFYRIQIGIP